MKTSKKKPITGSDSARKNTTSQVYTNLTSIPTHLILADFETVLLNHYGCLPKGGIDTSGRIQRFHIRGHKKGSKNGYIRVHMDGVPTIHMGNFKDGTSLNHSFNIGRSLTTAELAEQKRSANKARVARAKETAKKQEATSKKAIILWRKLQPASADNAYLIKKHMLPDGLKETKDGAIVAPIWNDKVLVGLQFITFHYIIRNHPKTLQNPYSIGIYHTFGLCSYSPQFVDIRL